MVEHLGGHAALEIEQVGHTPQPRERGADQRALVQVAMQHVGAQLPQAQGAKGQQHVEGELVARRAHLIVAAPGQAGGAANVQLGQVASIVIGADGDPMPAALQVARLRRCAMTAIVAKRTSARASGCVASDRSQDATASGGGRAGRGSRQRHAQLRTARGSRAITRILAPVCALPCADSGSPALQPGGTRRAWRHQKLGAKSPRATLHLLDDLAAKELECTVDVAGGVAEHQVDQPAQPLPNSVRYGSLRS